MVTIFDLVVCVFLKIIDGRFDNLSYLSGDLCIMASPNCEPMLNYGCCHSPTNFKR